MTPVPATNDTIVCYIAHLARTMLPQSVKIYLNIIRIMHEEAGLKNPLENNYEISMIKRGLSRVKGVPPKQKEPITIPILLELYEGLNLANNFEKSFWSAILVGFYGFLRKSSLLPVNDSSPPNKRLSRRDVKALSLTSFELTCNASKTNQFGQRVHVIPYVKCSDRRLCPVLAMLTHLGANRLGDLSPLFNYTAGGVEIFLSHNAFVNRLKAGIKKTGRNPKTISCHSLRRGGATLSFECGLSPDQIKLRGDWVSEAYQRYVHISPTDSYRVAERLSKGAAAKVTNRAITQAM